MEQSKILPNGLGLPNQRNHTKLIKSVILSIVAIVSFGATWQLLALGFAQGSSLLFWIYPGITASLGVVFLTFLAVVNRNIFLWVATGLAIFGWYLAVMPKNWYVAIGGILFCFATFLFVNRIKHDEKSRADFSMSRVVRSSIAVIVYGLLAIVAFNIYAEAQVAFKKNPKQFYNQIGHYAARGLEYVPASLGDFNPDQRFDDFVFKQAQRQNPDLAEIPAVERKSILAGVKQQLLDQFHIQVVDNPLLGQVVAGAVSQKVEDGGKAYEKFFPAIFAVIVFSLLRTVAFVFVWLTMFLSWLIFRFLLLVKFFRIEKVQVEINKLQI